jgi:hypothetical protein
MSGEKTRVLNYDSQLVMSVYDRVDISTSFVTLLLLR